MEGYHIRKLGGINCKKAHINLIITTKALRKKWTRKDQQGSRDSFLKK